MRVYSIIIWNLEKKVQLSELVNLEDFNFWEKSIALNIIRKISQLTIEVTEPGKQISILHEGYLCHVLNRNNGLACAIITDQEYPSRVSFDIIIYYSDQYYKEYGLNFPSEPFLYDYIIEIQNPKDIDKLTKIKNDIDNTKEIVLETIEQLISRGEKLENLNNKSNKLVDDAKKFQTQSQELNACCNIL